MAEATIETLTFQNQGRLTDSGKVKAPPQAFAGALFP